jgi:hypothetical protein
MREMVANFGRQAGGGRRKGSAIGVETGAIWHGSMVRLVDRVWVRFWVRFAGVFLQFALFSMSWRRKMGSFGKFTKKERINGWQRRSFDSSIA